VPGRPSLHTVPSLGTVTSLDGDGSTRKDPLHDEVRQAAPADPWLTEAPTSAISDTPTLQDFHTGPAKTRPALAPFPRWYHPRRDRRRRRRIVAVLAAGVLFVAGIIALNPFGADDDGGDATGPTPATGPTTASTTTARPAANLPAASGAASTATSRSAAPAAPAAGAPQVVYEVTASGSKNTGSVVYTDQNGDIIRLNGVPLPWRTTFPVGAQRKPLILDTQRKGGGDTGPVTCTITVGGKVLASTTAEGRYAAALCSGSA
jgi:hypothetical protein